MDGYVVWGVETTDGSDSCTNTVNINSLKTNELHI